MRTLKTIRLFYIFYTLYTFFVMAVSDYKAIYAVVGLISIWALYFAFSLGFRSSKNLRNIDNDEAQQETDEVGVSFPFSNIGNWRNIFYIINVIICWICSILAARFYTSRNFSSVITALFNGTGGYAIYQRYVREANIGAFTLSKIPYILMLTYCTAMVFWSIVAILLSNKKHRPFQIFYVVMIILAYLYFGIARGTNYEMYIIFVSLVYCILNRPNRKQRSFIENRKRVFLVSSIGIVMVIVFRIVVENRGFVFRNQICTEITYDPDKFVSMLFPAITTMGLAVFRYLGWGIFTIGYMKWIALDSFSSIMALLIPQGQRIIFDNTWVELTRHTVDVGVGWVPDYMSLLDLLGLPLMFVALFIIGRVVVKLKLSDKPRLLVNLIGLFVFIEMLSIPVGNFLVTSTPIMLSLLASLLWYGKCILVSYRQRRRHG